MELNQNIANHYLQVQALTPQSGVPVVSLSKPPAHPSLLFGLNPTEITVISAFFVVGIAILVLSLVNNFKKALTILSIFLMTSAVPISVIIMNQQTNIESNAGPDYVPKNVLVTKVTPVSFNVMWDTDRPGTGVVRIRTTKDDSSYNQIFSEAEEGEIYKHIIKIDKLTPNTTYYLEILSGGVWYDNHSQPLIVKTPV